MTGAATRLAPAKVNLYLHVGPPGADGYHPLASLVVFADVGDRLSLEPAQAFAFAVTGPFAPALADECDNLVVRAVGALAEQAGSAIPAIRLTLDKQLPVAAGLGGGSSDAAAALRLVRDDAFPTIGDDALRGILADIGADGPMCLAAAPLTALGRGDALSPAPHLPELHAVLVNPGVAAPTGAIYAAYDRAGRFGGAGKGDLRTAYGSTAELAADLADCRNDLQAPAVAAAAEIGEALAWLDAHRDCLLARMSGSGATVFALCAGPGAVARLAQSIYDAHPEWWVRPCRLGGPWA